MQYDKIYVYVTDKEEKNINNIFNINKKEIKNEIRSNDNTNQS